MSNLDSILKSRDITLPTKVCLVKAMAFPVVMYGCESWTVQSQLTSLGPLPGLDSSVWSWLALSGHLLVP